MGITDFTIEIAAGNRTAEEISELSGLSREEVMKVLPSGRLSYLPEGQMPWDIAHVAVEKLLSRNEIDADDVGLVIYAGSAEWGKPFWSPAGKIAQRAGIHHAQCIEVSNFCNAGLAAVSLANDHVKLGAHKAALVIIADPLSRLVDYPGQLLELFNFADGAAAVLISPEHKYELVGSAHRTDPAWVDYYYGAIRDQEVKVFREETERTGLGEAFTENFVGLTRSVLEDAKREVEEVSYVLVTHGNINLHRDYLGALGVPEDRSVFLYDEDGHLGGVDVFLALERLQEQEKLTSGDVVVLATAGSGFTWGVAALEVV